MQVRVSSMSQAEELGKDWADFAVSLIDPDTRELPKFDSATLHMSIVMEDTEIASDPWSPKLGDIAAIFLLADTKDRILVHCHGGISRSTAVGVGLLIADGMSVEEAVRTVHLQRPNMSPNKLILKHVDTHLSMGGTLVQQVQKVLDTFPKDLELWCDKCKVHFRDGDNCPGKHFL